MKASGTKIISTVLAKWSMLQEDTTSATTLKARNTVKENGCLLRELLTQGNGKREKAMDRAHYITQTGASIRVKYLTAKRMALEESQEVNLNIRAISRRASTKALASLPILRGCMRDSSSRESVRDMESK